MEKFLLGIGLESGGSYDERLLTKACSWPEGKSTGVCWWARLGLRRG